MNARRLLATIVAALALARGHPADADDWLCWTASQLERIECAWSDGTQRQTIVNLTGKPMGMAVDSVAGTMFWAERDTERIVALRLEGGFLPSTLVELPINAGVRGLAVAPSAGKLYWVAENLQAIHRANLDGGQVEALGVPPGSFFDVEVDEARGSLYWTSGDEIWRSGLDGSSAAPILADTEQPYYIAIDSDAGKIYWTDFGAFEIGRANLDGSQREWPGPVSGLPDRPIGIALDAAAGKVYWTTESGSVQRANLDGTGLETVLDGLESAWDISRLATLPTAGTVPALSGWGILSLALGMTLLGAVLVRRHERLRPVGIPSGSDGFRDSRRPGTLR